MESAIIVFTKTPYGHINFIEAARVAQGLRVLDKEVACVFLDDAVYGLLKRQDTSGIGMHSVKPVLTYLKSSEIDIYVVKDSLGERGLDISMIDEEYGVKSISFEDFSALQEKFDTTIFF